MLMKELDIFTVERLEELGAGAMFFTGDEVAALARIALAAKRAEPVAWTSQRSLETKNKIVAFTDDMSALDYGTANGWADIVELYTTPQLNSPQGWINCSDQMPEDCQTVLCNNMLTELSGIPFIADYVGMFDLHDGTRYEAGFYVNRTPQTVTHWMTLPAAPEKPL